MTVLASPSLDKPFARFMLIAWRVATIVLAVVGLIGLALQHRSPANLGPSPDATSYAYQALQIAKGNFFSIPWVGENGQGPNVPDALYPSRYPPGFSAVLAIFPLILRGGLGDVLAGSAVISGLLLLATGFVAWRIGGWRVAFISMSAVLISPLIWRSATIVMSDAFGALLIVLAVWLFYEHRQATRRAVQVRLLVALGFLLGFAVFSRFALIIFAVVAFVAIRNWKNILILCVAAAPWAIILALYQWKAYGSPLTTGYSYWLPGLQEFYWTNPLQWNIMGEGPFIYPDQLNGAAFQFACPCKYPDGGVMMKTPPLITYPASLLGLYWVTIPPLFGLFGFYRAWKTRSDRTTQFFMGSLVLNLVFFAFYFYAGVRFLLPVAILLTIWSSLGMFDLVDAIVARVSRRQKNNPLGVVSVESSDEAVTRASGG